MDRILTAPDVLNIPKEDLPLFVFSDNPTSFFSWGIKSHQKGFYNHFMWMVEPCMFATQGKVFKSVHVTNFLKTHRLKFCTNSNWDEFNKKILIFKIKSDLEKPFLKRLYDPIQIFGIFIGKFLPFSTRWIQIPGLDICSDKAEYLKLVDKEFNLKHPSPTDINKWMKANQDRGYRVYGRYFVD